MAHALSSALIMVDLQNDFCLSSGQLPVPRGSEIIPLANQLQAYFPLVIATQDWHLPHHISFAANHPGKHIGEVIHTQQGITQVLWPIHCVQGTPGAALHPDLSTARIQHMIHKGTQATIDSYSAFFDNAHLVETELAALLRAHQVHTIYLMGLALDYCVKYSALDAVALGFHTTVIIDACRSISKDMHTIQALLDQFKQQGIATTTTSAIFATMLPRDQQTPA